MRPKYSNEIFHRDTEPMRIPFLILATMKISFTKNEIKAVIKLKSNKNPGKDEISKLMNSASDILYEQIAKVYCNIFETGEHLNEITLVILRPLQKPGKPKGPPLNLRPIILLSILKKIFMCRIDDRLDAEISPTQAAHRKYRSVTEHVFATKMNIERKISVKNQTAHLLLDMAYLPT